MMMILKLKETLTRGSCLISTNMSFYVTRKDAASGKCVPLILLDGQHFALIKDFQENSLTQIFPSQKERLLTDSRSVSEHLSELSDEVH